MSSVFGYVAYPTWLGRPATIRDCLKEKVYKTPHGARIAARHYSLYHVRGNYHNWRAADYENRRSLVPSREEMSDLADIATDYLYHVRPVTVVIGD